MQTGEKRVALFTPVQEWESSGARHLRSPTGAAANGIPLKTMAPWSLVPLTSPLSVRTGCDIPDVAAKPVTAIAEIRLKVLSAMKFTALPMRDRCTR